MRARHCLALFTRGNPRAVLEVSLETAAVLTTRSLVGVPALQVRLLGVGRAGRGAVTWGGERGVGLPGEGGEDGGQPQLEAGESRGEDGGRGSRLKLMTAMLPVGGAAEGGEAWGTCRGAVAARSRGPGAVLRGTLWPSSGPASLPLEVL